MAERVHSGRRGKPGRQGQGQLGTANLDIGLDVHAADAELMFTGRGMYVAAARPVGRAARIRSGKPWAANPPSVRISGRRTPHTAIVSRGNGRHHSTSP